jgi:hypothetical protein
MKVEISFVVGESKEPDHRTDSRFSKVFEVEWPGRPMPGETIELDVGPPLEEASFEVTGIYWLTEKPTSIYLERIVVSADEVEWDGGLTGYGRYCRRQGWEVMGPAGREMKPPAE